MVILHSLEGLKKACTVNPAGRQLRSVSEHPGGWEAPGSAEDQSIPPGQWPQSHRKSKRSQIQVTGGRRTHGEEPPPEAREVAPAAGQQNLTEESVQVSLLTKKLIQEIHF